MEKAKLAKLNQDAVDTKPQNKCVLLLRAIFCLKTKNSVSKEAELAQISRLSSPKVSGVNANDQTQNDAKQTENEPLLPTGGEVMPEPEETQGDLSNTKSKAAEEIVVDDEVEDDENRAAKQGSTHSVTETDESAPYAPSDHNKDSD